LISCPHAKDSSLALRKIGMRFQEINSEAPVKGKDMRNPLNQPSRGIDFIERLLKI